MNEPSSPIEDAPVARMTSASVGKGARAGFALAVLVLLASGWISYHNLQRISRNAAWVVHTYQVLDTLRDVSANLTEAESGQRGYIVTGEASYAEPYRAAATSLRGHLDKIRNLVSDNPPQEERAKLLDQKCSARFQTLGLGIAAREANGFEGGRNFILSGQGKQEMEEVRAQIAEMVSVEFGLLATREAQSRASYSNAILTVITSGLLGLTLVGTAYAMAAREVATRHSSAESLLRANQELEGRVQERTAELEGTNESLQRSNRELEQFASVASHDLQEPLRKIQAFGDRLQTKCAAELGDNGREYLARMQASATRMRSLIDALLSFSRVTTKAQPFVPVNLDMTAQDVVSDLEDRVLRTGGRIEVGPLPTIDADPLQMRQLFQNLIANGLKFHQPGNAPVVQVEARLLNNNGESDGEAPVCEIAVRDNGIGFEEVYLDRIFELFQRLHGRQEYEGTGMGLAICRKIAERHGGGITAKSAPGDGATFLVTLPLRQMKES